MVTSHGPQPGSRSSLPSSLPPLPPCFPPPFPWPSSVLLPWLFSDRRVQVFAGQRPIRLLPPRFFLPITRAGPRKRPSEAFDRLRPPFPQVTGIPPYTPFFYPFLPSVPQSTTSMLPECPFCRSTFTLRLPGSGARTSVPEKP